MNGFSLIVLCALAGSLHAFSLGRPGIIKADPTLELVHVVFRHGNRNPDQSSLHKNNSYYNESYYPEGFGQLTNEGKRTELQLGQLLRQRYDKFLGPVWNINDLDVRSTDMNRTKMSAQLVLAGLYPPRLNQIWSLLAWQPIPYNYVPYESDKVLGTFASCYSKIDTLKSEVLNSPEINQYIQERYSEALELLSEKFGENVSFTSAGNYYFGFLVQEQLGFELPEWIEPIYPEPLNSIAVDNYYIQTNNTALRRIMAGYFLRKVLDDTKSKIDGTLSPSQRKVFVYSGHEINVASVLLSLDAYKLSSIPNYGSNVLLEVHKVKGIYGLKLFFQNYERLNPIPIRIPGCDYFCPYEDFYSLVEEILPESNADC